MSATIEERGRRLIALASSGGFAPIIRFIDDVLWAPSEAEAKSIAVRGVSTAGLSALASSAIADEEEAVRAVVDELWLTLRPHVALRKLDVPDPTESWPTDANTGLRMASQCRAVRSELRARGYVVASGGDEQLSREEDSVIRLATGYWGPPA